MCPHQVVLLPVLVTLLLVTLLLVHLPQSPSLNRLGLEPGTGWVPCTLLAPFPLSSSAFLLRNSMLFSGLAMIDRVVSDPIG